MKSRGVELPFRLDKCSRDSLVDQFVVAIRKAVRAGKLRKGDVLPGFRAMADELGVSMRIPCAGVKALCEKGILSARRGVGTVVLGGRPNRIGRRVLLVHQFTHGGYYLNMFLGLVSLALSRENVVVVQHPVMGNLRGKHDVRALDAILRREDFDAALIITYEDAMIATLEEADVPYVACTFYPKRYANAVGLVNFSHREAIRDFVAQCVREKVRSVMQVLVSPEALDVERTLASRGIAVETVQIPVAFGSGFTIETVQHDALLALRKRLRGGPLPDVILFADDIAARGGLAALAESGVRIPRDVRVVSWVNSGFAPASSVALTRMEMDPVEHAGRVSAAFLEYLRSGRFEKGMVLGPKYVRGESF